MSYNLTQFWHYLDSIRPHRLTAQSHKTVLHFRYQLQVVGPQVTHNLCLTCIPVGGPHDLLPPVCDYLLEQPTELRETFTYIYQFIEGHAKGYK